MSRANIVSKADSASSFDFSSVFGGLGFGIIAFWSSLALRPSRLANISDGLKQAAVTGSLGASCLFITISNSRIVEIVSTHPSSALGFMMTGAGGLSGAGTAFGTLTGGPEERTTFTTVFFRLILTGPAAG
jgi:hypothetical protein